MILSNGINYVIKLRISYPSSFSSTNFFFCLRPMDIVRSDPIPIPKKARIVKYPWEETSPLSNNATTIWFSDDRDLQYSLDQNPPTPPSFTPPKSRFGKNWDKLVMDKLAVSPSVYDHYSPPRQNA